jgi:hypothetical protein
MATTQTVKNRQTDVPNQDDTDPYATPAPTPAPDEVITQPPAPAPVPQPADGVRPGGPNDPTVTPPGYKPPSQTKPVEPVADPTDFQSRIRAAYQLAQHRDPTDQEMQYWLGKQASGETSGWATGAPGRTMDDYWVERAKGMGAGGGDMAQYGPYSLAAGYTPQYDTPATATGQSLASILPQWMTTPPAWWAGGSSAPAAPTSSLNPQLSALMQQRLIDLMGRSTVPSENDPEIKATLDASRLAGQRAYERDSAQLAEQMAYTGMSNSGAMESALAGLRATRAQTEQTIAAGTFQDAANRRIQELQNTLQLVGNQLNEDQRNALQLEIAQLQDATERAKIGEGARQFDADLYEKIRQFGLDDAYRQAALAQTGYQFSTNLAEQQRQFNQNLLEKQTEFDTTQNARNPLGGS